MKLTNVNLNCMTKMKTLWASSTEEFIDYILHMQSEEG
jgi:hypothetical protein